MLTCLGFLEVDVGAWKVFSDFSGFELSFLTSNKMFRGFGRFQRSRSVFGRSTTKMTTRNLQTHIFILFNHQLFLTFKVLRIEKIELDHKKPSFLCGV